MWKNLLVMVGVPYLKRKLDEAYAVQVPQAALVGRRFNRDTLPPDATLRQRVAFCYKWFLRSGYPSLNAAYYFSFLVFNLAYLFSNTAYASPLLWLVRTRVRRLDALDYRAIELASQRAAAAPSARPGLKSLLSPRNLVTLAYSRTLSGLRLAFPASIFALKFLEWWHASDFARQLSQQTADTRELPPPTISGVPERMPEKTEQAKEDGDREDSNRARDSTGTSAMDAPNRDARRRKAKPPIGATSRLPILTVPAPTASTSALCPICMKDIVNPTAAQTGFVYCYTCIFRWVDGSHDRQEAWMKGGSGGEGWGDEEAEDSDDADRDEVVIKGEKDASREGRWESGTGRCAVTGRRLLGGTGGLRRVII